ncbi:hypothetical protein SAMN05920897_11935 [Alkalispirochaeta americana]|uniref:ABC transmembrane type-1 domain-containing protein n=1 Tax=Alkalispirochaeta americana TaxID=159291 RepID=A0A1N6WYA8_9SPIO|nr:hypothetical protein [Alkalispirochaeta americana]SIQ95005.1 hypothetical protein SAMN05920897_11935 [Alkalispirochaeta americana]
MNILTVFKESITASRDNPLLFVPMLASLVFSMIVNLVFAGSAMPMLGNLSGEQIAANPERALAGAGAAIGGIMIVSTISSFVSFLAHGMTVGMADMALKGESVTLQTGWDRLVSRIIPLVITSVMVIVIVMFGFILLILPGLIAAFFLMFALVAVMLENFSAGKALGHSIKTVKKNMGAALITLLLILGLTFPVLVLNFAIVFIPILGVILSTILFSIYTAFITILLVRVYHSLDVQSDRSPEVEA